MHGSRLRFGNFAPVGLPQAQFSASRVTRFRELWLAFGSLLCADDSSRVEAEIECTVLQEIASLKFCVSFSAADDRFSLVFLKYAWDLGSGLVCYICTVL